MARKKLMKVFAGAAAALIAVSAASDICRLPAGGFNITAVAEETEKKIYTRKAGDFTITSEVELLPGIHYRYIVDNRKKIYTVMSDTPITISNTIGHIQCSTAIEIAPDTNANITLAGVNTDVSYLDNMPAFKIPDNSTGNVTLTLVGDNYFRSGNFCAGIQKNGSGEGIGKLTITGTGSLTAIGGECSAGIGGGCGTFARNGSCANIEILSGTITAKGGMYGAGIGGGDRYEAKDIKISGGNITAIPGADCYNQVGGGRGMPAMESVTKNGKTLYWFQMEAHSADRIIYINNVSYNPNEKCIVTAYIENGTLEKPVKVVENEVTTYYIFNTDTHKWLKVAEPFAEPAEGLVFVNRNLVLVSDAYTSDDSAKIEYSLSKSGPYSTVKPVAKDAGTYTVWYRIKNDGTFTETEPKSFEVSIAAGAKPQPTATAKKKSVQLSWSSMDGTTNYSVYMLKNGKYTKIAETKKTTYTVKNLKPGKKYKFIVRAFSYGKWTPLDKADAISVKTLK